MFLLGRPISLKFVVLPSSKLYITIDSLVFDLCILTEHTVIDCSFEYLLLPTHIGVILKS